MVVGFLLAEDDMVMNEKINLSSKQSNFRLRVAKNVNVTNLMIGQYMCCLKYKFPRKSFQIQNIVCFNDQRCISIKVINLFYEFVKIILQIIHFWSVLCSAHGVKISLNAFCEDNLETSEGYKRLPKTQTHEVHWTKIV